jgi:hypothetical protein
MRITISFDAVNTVSAGEILKSVSDKLIANREFSNHGFYIRDNKSHVIGRLWIDDSSKEASDAGK